jgi:hypothetical protein
VPNDSGGSATATTGGTAPSSTAGGDPGHFTQPPTAPADSDVFVANPGTGVIHRLSTQTHAVD